MSEKEKEEKLKSLISILRGISPFHNAARAKKFTGSNNAFVHL